MLSVSELSAPKLKPTSALRSASSTGGPGPVSVFATPRPVPTHWRDRPKLTLHSSSQLVTWTGFGPFFTAPNPTEFREEFQNPEGRQALHPCLNRLTECSFRNPFGSDRRDPKLTRAEQEES